MRYNGGLIMRYKIRKNWSETLGIMAKNPIILMPFVFIAFFELLALEFLYFSSRFPLSYITNPIVRKFFGENFIHYPGNLVILPRLFYYEQVVIYIFAGAFLTAMAVNIFKNIKGGLPVKMKAMGRNILKRYASLMIYAILISVLVVILQKADIFIFSKAMRLLSRLLPVSIAPLYGIGLTLVLFLSNLIMQTFLIATIPIMVIEKAPLLKALARSVMLGLRNFPTVFTLILLPFFIYLPIILFKSFSAQIMNKTSPEVILYVTVAGIMLTIFLDSFVIISVSQFLLDRKKIPAGKTA
jgi:hypothetical protein